MFNKEKKIDFARAYERVGREIKEVGRFALKEAENAARFVRVGEEKIVASAKEAEKKVGDFIVAEEKKIIGQAKEFYGNLPPVKKKRRLAKIAGRLRLFAPLLIGLAALLVVLTGISAWMFSVIIFKSLEGRENLLSAAALAREKDFEGSMALSRSAEMNFKSASAKADEINSSVLRYIPLVGSTAEDLKYLTVTADILARTVSRGTIFYRELQNLIAREDNDFSKLSQEEKGKVLGYLYESGPELAGLKANLDLASLNLQKVRFPLILYPAQGKINDLKEQVDMGREFLARAIPAAKFLPELAGYPEKKNFLFLLENNDELRPAGGFIGNYGVMETYYGDIVKFDTEDSYHLDMPVKDKINVDPPAPLKEYLAQKWYFRDSNWSPDFPETARTAEWFFNEETRLSGKDAKAAELFASAPGGVSAEAGNFDGIIAITPKFITDLLAITGPMTIGGHEYNKDNFSELLEWRVEVAYRDLGESEWNRKEMVGMIAQELKIRLFDLPFSRWGEIFKAVDSNIDEKNIMMYFKDCDLERLAVEEGIAGEMKPADNDYFMAVDANLAAFKSDSVMNKNIIYEVREKDGALYAKVTLNYAHQGDFSWRSTKYRSYTRIFVPAGSELVSADGFESSVAEELKENSFPSECGSVADDKTYFGGFFTVEPGKIKNIAIEYRLPAGIYKKYAEDRYELYLQKQPGNRVSEAEVELSFGKNITAYSPAGFSADKVKDNMIIWKTDLNTDKMFGVDLE
ncbi:MAG: DUF4012 domain-containing protein [Patescibacteria group bacterium]|jgi:hypothetical protein